jgi:hypothetical protein
VGSALDLSATYYNPGSLALVPNPKVILTASVFQIETIKVSSVDPTHETVRSQGIGTAPSLFAGTLPVHWWGGRWAYSFLTRQKLSFRLVDRQGLIIGQDAAGDSLSLGGEILYDQWVDEQWGGLTYSKKTSDHIGVGATLYGVYREQSFSRRQTVEAIGASGYGASLVDWTDFDYATLRMLVKMGIEGEFGNSSLGLAFTTESLLIGGSGTMLLNRVVIGDTNLDGIDDSRAAISHGKGVPAHYRSPFSIAVGGSHHFTNYTIHATAEYFTAIDPYTVMETPAAENSPGVTTYPSKVQHALNDVFNWGVGVEKVFSPKTTGYISFITDNSASRPVKPADISVSTWNLYHINGGVAFTIRGTDLTVGGGFAWGSAPLAATPDSEGILPPTIRPNEVSYTRLKAILGFSL